jgi:hypothetical protein
MNSLQIKKELQYIIADYQEFIKSIDDKAKKKASERAYGGILRSEKGTFVEKSCKKLIELSWLALGGEKEQISFEKQIVKVPLNKSYLNNIANEQVRNWIKENIKDFYYNLKVDVHTYINDKFVLAVECKTYTENAMLKRILVDFSLLQKTSPELSCVLFQLESQLGGDYAQIHQEITYGSYSTHTLLSYFDVNLHIITLLEGERKVDEPIHKKEFFKELKESHLEKAIQVFKNILQSKL